MSDLYLHPTADGGEILILGGEPRTTSGLDTAVYLSLFTTEWWGNVVSDQAERFSSQLEEAMTRPLNSETRLLVEDAARSALTWLTDEGVADSVEVRAEIADVAELRLAVRVTEPGGDAQDLVYALNWEAQRALLGEQGSLEVDRLYLTALIEEGGAAMVTESGDPMSAGTIVRETL